MIFLHVCVLLAMKDVESTLVEKCTDARNETLLVGAIDQEDDGSLFHVFIPSGVLAAQRSGERKR